MAESPTPGADAGSAAVKPVDPKLLTAYVAEEVRAGAKNEAAYAKATKDAGDDAAKLAAALADHEKANAAVREGILSRFKSDAHKAQYVAAHEAQSAGIKSALESATKMTKMFVEAHSNSGKLALAGAAAAAAGMLLPSKEVEKADGGTEKKGSLFKKALVTIGAVVAVGAAMNKYGPAKGWVGKIAADRLLNAAKGSSVSPG